MKFCLFAVFLLPALCLAASEAPEGKPVMEVLLPARSVLCSCEAALAVPEVGSFNCPGSNPPQIAVQIIWQDTKAKPGDCNVGGEGECADKTDAACTADVPPLAVTLYNCWASGRWMTATGLQNGARFFHSNNDGTTFDPDLSAPCKTGTDPTTAVYKIEFWSGQIGGTKDCDFIFTLKCSPCASGH